MESKTLKGLNYEISIFEKFPFKKINIFFKLSKYNFAFGNNNDFGNENVIGQKYSCRLKFFAVFREFFSHIRWGSCSSSRTPCSGNHAPTYTISSAPPSLSIGRGQWGNYWLFKILKGLSPEIVEA
jgi:hypothetical protein